MKMLLLALVLVASPVQAKDLYVNAATGNDATTYAANSAATPWRSIGRAAWGSATRSSPASAEAAMAGDTVYVSGGTYSSSLSGGSRWAVLYNPVNQGTSSSAYVGFTCVGVCVLTAQNWNGPVVGSDGRAWVKWFANVSSGHEWQITACGRQDGACNTASVVNTTPDTGPIVCHDHGGTCWIEGFDVNGGQQLDYTDNWPGLRCEATAGNCMVRNNVFAQFKNASTSVNSVGVQIYCSPGSIVEHNDISDSGGGVSLKDQADSCGSQNDVTVRYNRIINVGVGVVSSITGAQGSERDVYQNLISGATHCFFLTGLGFGRGDDVVNNTCVNASEGFHIAGSSASAGPARFWGNIVQAAQIYFFNANGVVESVFDAEHNCFDQDYREFGYASNVPRATLAAWTAAYPGQEVTSTASAQHSDLQFTNAAAGTYTLGASSPCRGVQVDILDLDGDGSTSNAVPAGAYVTGAEVIGPGGSVVTPPPETPVDCAVSAWSFSSATLWSECTNGTQTRTETWTRTVVTPASNGGTSCPALSELRAASQLCVVPPPAVFQCQVTGEPRSYADGDIKRTIRCDTNGPANLPVGTMFTIPRP